MIGTLQTLGEALQKTDCDGNQPVDHTLTHTESDKDAMPTLPEDGAPSEVCESPERSPPPPVCDGHDVRVSESVQPPKPVRKGIRRVLLPWLRCCIQNVGTVPKAQ